MRRYCTVAVVLGFALLLPAAAHAAQFPVTAPTDAALRAAVNAANDAEGPDEVLLNGHTVVLEEGDLDVDDDLTLRGPGVIDGSRLEIDAILEVEAPLTIDGVRLINSNEDRAVLVLRPVGVRVERSEFVSNEEGAIGFYPAVVETEALRVADASLTVSDSTFEGNTGRNGGAIDVDPRSQLAVAVTVARSTFAGNRAVGDGEGDARGGAINIWNGTLTVENSTFSGNRVNGPSFGSGGGAIAVDYGALATLTHVTITGNLAEGRARGGGIAGPRYEAIGLAKALSIVPVMVTNSIVAGNTSEQPEEASAIAAVRTDDCDLPVGTNGGNLEGGVTCGFRDASDKQNADPKLAALAANGGPTRTHALAADSPAVNMAVAGRCLATDQRSIPRVAAACDSGAYELVPPSTQPIQQPSAGGVLGEQASSCLSERRFKIRLRVPRGEEVRKAIVKVNGKRVKVKRGKRLTAIVDLRGLTKKRYKVNITLHLKGGEKVSGVRRYWTCTPAIRWTKPPKV